MAERPIIIRGVCDTNPDQHVHVSRGDKVRWRADHAEIFALHIKGGFFQDYPTDFILWVLAEIWTTDYVVARRGGQSTQELHLRSPGEELPGGTLGRAAGHHHRFRIGKAPEEGRRFEEKSPPRRRSGRPQSIASEPP